MGEDKYQDGYIGNQFIKNTWTDEVVEIMVNDNGIIGVSYYSPLQVQDIIVDHSAIKSFDETKEVFEKMISISYADESGAMYDIEVDKVKLGYTIVSEKGNFDNGIMIPAWMFFGTITEQNSGEKSSEKLLMSINAIDGTVINRELGY